MIRVYYLAPGLSRWEARYGKTILGCGTAHSKMAALQAGKCYIGM